MPKHIISNNDVATIARLKAGIPRIYTKGEVAKEYMDVYPYDLTLSDLQINEIIDWRNLNGHNELNLSNAIVQYHKNSMKNTKPVKYSGGFWTNGLANLGRSALGVLDIPRKVIAYANNYKSNDPDYHPGMILDINDNHSTPIMGKLFALKHPYISAGTDIVIPALATMGIGGAANIGKNMMSYATRSLVVGPMKSVLLNKMAKGTLVPNLEVEVITSVGNATKGTKAAGVVAKSSKPTKFSKPNGTSNPATGRPNRISKGTNTEKYGYSHYTYNTPKTSTSVTTWKSYPWTPVPLFGMPLTVTPPMVPTKGNASTIYTDSNVNVGQDDIIRWAIANKGMKLGDTIVMPDGRAIRYIVAKGGKNSTKGYLLGVHNEYDGSDYNVRKQYHIPSKSTITKGGVEGVRRTRGGQPANLSRNKLRYFPYIVPLSN